jgi:uncharacterized membrane protein
MEPAHLQFLPHPAIYFILFLAILGLLFALLRYVLVAFAYERLGLSRRGAMWVLFGALVGSAVNIPVAEFPGRTVVQPGVVDFFGIQYVVPQVIEQGRTVLAVNGGGAIIPLIVVAWLIARRGFSRRTLVVTAVVTIIINFLAQPVPGVGIALPPLLPPILIAGLALLFDPDEAPRTAFIAGTLGTLIGADLLNLGVIRDLGAPVASIGGAGTFDGIFLNGVFAVLLTGFPGLGRRLRRGRLGAPPSDSQLPPSDHTRAA